MNSIIRGLGLIASGLLVACGGGGGGGTAAPSTPQAVVITQGNAKPVAANALNSVQNTSATQSGAGVVTGVQVDAVNAPVQSNLIVISQAARMSVEMASAHAATLPVGIVINDTFACALGGSLTVSGSIASTNGLSAGDSLNVTYNACRMNSDGTDATLSGGLAINIVSGSLMSIPAQVVLATTANNLSVQSGGSTVVTSGDARMDIAVASSTSVAVTATGAAITSRITTTAGAFTTTFRNYTQRVSVNGITISGSLSASVETDSTRVGSAGGSYTITTPTAVVWNASTGAVTAGVVKVVGAANSQLVATIGSNGAVALQVDANGDGTFEATSSSSIAELRTLL
jgi:hypothetical protein